MDYRDTIECIIDNIGNEEFFKILADIYDDLRDEWGGTASEPFFSNVAETLRQISREA